MKNILKMLVLAGILLTGLASCEKETVLSEAEIPEEITEYIETHFPDNKIIQIVKDVEGFTKTYEVFLQGDFWLEFNRQKEIIDIEGRTELPASVIPTKIAEYVNETFPDNFILEWELERKKQKVGLDNDIDIEFNLDGDFIRIDD